ncbi:MAG TPA: ParB/RepB/Spo0J family partition protein [Patescibacteria group bacterium]|nr:ParB/RepB/Spo0J family partition protein [Patescibacteria group bacterium]
MIGIKMDSIVPAHQQNPQSQQFPQQPQPPQKPQDDAVFDSIMATPAVEPTPPPVPPYNPEPVERLSDSFLEELEEPEIHDEPDVEVEPVVAPEPLAEQNLPTEKVSYADSTIQELEIAKIIANPYQPRTQFKPEALQELSDSIKEHGVIQPVVVTQTPNGYELVVGERRFRASQLAGLTKIPAIVKQTLHDQTKLEVALIENIQRQELNAIEEARGYDRLIKSFNLTQDQVAKKVGKSRSAVANTLRLLNLPAEIQRGVIEGKVSEGHARAILGLGDNIEKMILMYQTILDQGLNVRQVEAKVREITVKRRLDAATPDPKLMAIETELRGKLGAQVKISRQGRGGKITIDFFSDEDLEEILNRMAEQQQANGDDNYLVV